MSKYTLTTIVAMLARRHIFLHNKEIYSLAFHYLGIVSLYRRLIQILGCLRTADGCVYIFFAGYDWILLTKSCYTVNVFYYDKKAFAFIRNCHTSKDAPCCPSLNASPLDAYFRLSNSWVGSRLLFTTTDTPQLDEKIKLGE